MYCIILYCLNVFLFIAWYCIVRGVTVKSRSLWNQVMSEKKNLKNVSTMVLKDGFVGEVKW